MYDVKPNLILGFHGCERTVRDQLLNTPNDVIISQKPFDWLGHGMYFWENNYARAFQWALDKKKRGGIKTPAVIGAVLSLGYCCDFLDAQCIQILKRYYATMASSYRSNGLTLPRNEDLPNDKYHDKILRVLDCTVIEYMHKNIFKKAQADVNQKGFTENKVFDSTRGVFMEGGPAFEGAGIFEKSHIQICVRNLNCIKGFFLPRQEVNFPEWGTAA